MGALTGATVAVVNNREKIIDAAEHLFQQGASFCQSKIDDFQNANHRFAHKIQDGFYADYEDASSEMPRGRSTGVDSDFDEPTTPEGSDIEDLDMEVDAQSLD